MLTSLPKPHRYTGFVMPKPSKLKLVPLRHSNESAGQRLARIRRERGFTQVELAEKLLIFKVRLSCYLPVLQTAVGAFVFGGSLHCVTCP